MLFWIFLHLFVLHVLHVELNNTFVIAFKAGDGQNGESEIRYGKNLIQFGDCKPYCDREKVKALIPSFIKAYSKKPWDRNVCGCLINHCFYNYVVAALSKATTIVENGVNIGGSGYFFRWARPDATIYHTDPLGHPVCKKTLKRWVDPGKSINRMGENFTDFFDIDWDKEPIESKSHTLVFFDTHQPDVKNVQKGLERGFSLFLLDDNYPPNDGGDMNGLSLKTFLSKQTDETKKFAQSLDFYYEMPAIINPFDVPKSLEEKYPKIFNERRRKWCERNHDFVLDPYDYEIGLNAPPLLDLHNPADVALFETIVQSNAVKNNDEYYYYNHMAVCGKKNAKA